MEDSITCAECGCNFDRKKSLIKHFKTFHFKTHNEQLEGVSCASCGLSFIYKGNLIRHIKAIHEKSSESEVTICWICKASYSSKANVLRHVKRKHPDSSIPEKKFKHQCSKCSRRFNQLYNLKFHLRKAHNLGLVEPSKHKCPLCCEHIPGSMKLILTHFIDRHGINIVKKELDFTSLKKFKNWKECVERETCARFIRFARRGDLRDEYRCHRSGCFVSKSKGLRKLKSKGSRKIDGICPANITLFKMGQNSYRAVFVETHVGHANDVEHLWLTEKDRLWIACRIACKIPFDTILDEMKLTASYSHLERKHLINKKDLYNIQAIYGLSNRRSDEDVGIDSWVVDTASTTNGCIIFYKAPGMKSQYHNLSVKDFVLILMNDLQSEVLIHHSKKTVCLDRTHCLNKHGFEMITVYILKDCDTFPCIFIVTNKVETVDFILYFTLIKEQVGNLEPEVIVTDLDESIYDAWCKVMGMPNQRAISPWHIDWAFRKNLVRIKNKDKQISVYKSLLSLLDDTDIKAFRTKFNLTIECLKNDSDTQDFYNYLKGNFIRNDPKWPRWHRVQCGFENYSDLELLHKTIKYLYLNKSNVSHVDRAISSIMKHVRDRHADKFFEFEDLGIKMREITARHNESVSQYSCVRIMEHGNTWKVDFPGIPDCDIYTVNEVTSMCSCSLLCEPCGVCLHAYSCTCLDSCLKWNFCKHIHLVCTYLNESKNQVHDNGIILYDYIDIPNQQVTSVNQQLQGVETMSTTVNIISSAYNNDVNSSIANTTLTNGAHSVTHLTTYDSDPSIPIANLQELTNVISHTSTSSVINRSTPLSDSITNMQSIISPPEINDQTSNMDSLIETLDHRRNILSRKILDLLEYVENVESFEMVDSIEKLLHPIDSILSTLKKL